MEDLNLTDTQQRYFGDLFLCCDSDNAGKIPVYKAFEFFRTSKVPGDTIRQITDMSIGGKSNTFNRKQFYTALKLIAASQAGLSVHSDLVNSVIEVPLPRFSWTNEENKSPDLIQLSDSVLKSDSSDHINSSDGEVDLIDKEEITKKEKKVNLQKCDRLSPGASSTASDSPTPTNSVQEKSWGIADHWQGLVSVCEEQRQLLGTEEESSDRHSSEEESDKELWVITAEQREYYTAQFSSLQPDLNALLAGSVARLFFEKSKLPVQELRKIWQLSDVTKDGSLSLEEFNTAMHLVVLRRNNIPLPDALPPSLVPTVSLVKQQQPPVPPPRDENHSPGQSSLSSEPQTSKQWTKFVDSPTSSISSPGPKPVNFDFHKSDVEQNPKIFHPVPLRVTPEAPSILNNEDDTRRSPRRSELDSILSDVNNVVLSHKKPLMTSMSQDSGSDIRPIQRPQPKKPAPGPGAIPPPPQQLPDDFASGPTSLPVSMPPKKEPPPPPPPRPDRTHARSSSLDLNKLGKSASLGAQTSSIPPRISPSTGTTAFADFAHFPGGEDEGIAEVDNLDSVPRTHGAFQIYRKQKYESQVASGVTETGSLTRLEQHNNLLSRTCQMLTYELAQIQEERNSLQLRLEQLKSTYNNNS